MLIYLLLDTSGSMDGAKIGSLNDCLENILVTLQEKVNGGTDIKMSVLTFARSAKWMCETPISPLDFCLKRMEANGMTSLGTACCKLSESIECQSSQDEDIIIFLLSDGCPTDDYEEGIHVLYGNESFINAKKYALALGDDADIPSLTRFVGSPDYIKKSEDVNDLLDMVLQVFESSPISVPPPSHDEEDDEWG